MPESVTTVFRYGALAVRLRLPAGMSAVELFLSRYFKPFFAIETDGTAERVEVSIEVSSTPPPAGAPSFESGQPVMIDGSKGFLSMTGRLVDRQDGRWVVLAPSGATVHIHRESRRVRLFAPIGADIRIAVLRLIEDIILNSVQNSGAIVLHASAVVADGVAVAAVGNKGAGKTSFLCHSLESFATTKLASDNVCVFVTEAGITLRGWPSFFKANVGTVVSHVALVDACPSCVRSKLGNDDEVWSIYDKVAMYPADAAAAFGSAITPEAPLGCLILPEFSKDKPVGVALVSPDEARNELPAFLQGVHNPNHPEWLGSNPVDTTAIAALLARLVEALKHFEIPIVRIRWAPSLRDLLRTVPELRRTDRLLNRARGAANLNTTVP